MGRLHWLLCQGQPRSNYSEHTSVEVALMFEVQVPLVGLENSGHEEFGWGGDLGGPGVATSAPWSPAGQVTNSILFC